MKDGSNMSIMSINVYLLLLFSYCLAKSSIHHYYYLQILVFSHHYYLYQFGIVIVIVIVIVMLLIIEMLLHDVSFSLLIITWYEPLALS